MSFLEQSPSEDSLARTLTNLAQGVLVFVFGLLPLFFLPSGIVPFEFTKIFFVLTGIVFALILLSLSILRAGKISIGFTYVLLSFWGIAIIGFISAFLSGDFRDAMFGDILSIHSAAFLGILALTATIWVLVGVSKSSIMRLYMLLMISSVVLVLFHFVRIIFGIDVLSFSVFTSSVSSPIGGWNDLALYLGLTILLSLLTLEQLKPSKMGRMFFVGVIVISLIMLTIINFFVVWLVLGLVSLVVLVYALKRNTLSLSKEIMSKTSMLNMSSLIPASLVFLVSVLFIIGGSFFGGIITDYTNVSFIEVRPSFEATSDIARNVYKENAFLGTGANKFVDAWRLYKKHIGKTY